MCGIFNRGFSDEVFVVFFFFSCSFVSSFNEEKVHRLQLGFHFVRNFQAAQASTTRLRATSTATSIWFFFFFIFIVVIPSSLCFCCDFDEVKNECGYRSCLLLVNILFVLTVYRNPMVWAAFFVIISETKCKYRAQSCQYL